MHWTGYVAATSLVETRLVFDVDVSNDDVRVFDVTTSLGNQSDI